MMRERLTKEEVMYLRAAARIAYEQVAGKLNSERSGPGSGTIRRIGLEEPGDRLGWTSDPTLIYKLVRKLVRMGYIEGVGAGGPSAGARTFRLTEAGFRVACLADTAPDDDTAAS